MLVMHYAGAAFEVDPALRSDLENAAKTAANTGEFVWIQLGADDGPKTARFLVGPAIPIAFVWEPDPTGDDTAST